MSAGSNEMLKNPSFCSKRWEFLD